jgi:tRNA pseudouridine38-40 synthase
MPRTLKITLAYDGTAYCGWQRQTDGVSIQGLLEGALGRIEGSPVTVHGAGRTDAGVHALGQVASAIVSSALDVHTLQRALNASLPSDVRVVAVDEMPDGFHARFSATGKAYEYWIFEGEVQPPFARVWSWHHPRTLDAAAMDRAAGAIVGTRDFSAFQSSRTDVKTVVRTVRHASVRAEPAHAGPGGLADQPASPGAGGRFVVIRVEANGFLRHMVRAIAGTLVEIGEGRREADTLPAIIASRDRAAAGATAPALGLVLVRVDYGAPTGAGRRPDPSPDHGPALGS